MGRKEIFTDICILVSGFSEQKRVSNIISILLVDLFSMPRFLTCIEIILHQIKYKNEFL